jgi:peptide/nickel transport system ATP-binding protein
MLELIDISKSFRTGFLGGNLKVAVEGASLKLARGEILGLIGESGCGKSTLARVALKLLPPTTGRIIIDGVDVTDMPERQFRGYRRRIQIVFQHPESALDPYYTLMDSINESFNRLALPSGERAVILEKLADEVSLPMDILDRYPNQVSGGEIQRAVLTRVFAFQPEYLVLDEPTSMLDVSVQAHILQLLKKKAKRDNIGMLFISHDLDVVRVICDRVMVMKAGRIIEEGSVARVFNHPSTKYMETLLMNI